MKWKVEYLEHFSSVFALKKITRPSFSQVSLYMHAYWIIKDEGDKTVNKKMGERGNGMIIRTKDEGKVKEWEERNESNTR